MKELRPQPIPFPLPATGLNTVTPRVGQPARSSIDLRNVRMFSRADGRMRVSTRPGTITLFGQTNVLGAATNSRNILGLHQARATNGTTYVLAIADGDLYQNTVGQGTIAATVNLRQVAATLTGRNVYFATDGGYSYYIDGASAHKLKLDDGTVSTWTATGGKGTVPTDFRFMLAARGRIWMAHQTSATNNWTCSRQGDVNDWKTDDEDVGASVVGNSGFRGGRVGEPINALIAGKDDTILFGCRNSIYELQGEPTLGALLVRSTGVGMLSPLGWCMGASGEIYFVASGGFYRLPVSGSPEPLNIDKVQTYFDALSDRGYYINCVWDPNNFGVHIFFAPDVATLAVDGITSTAAAHHLFYNARTDGFEPFDLPDDHGPLYAILYDGGRSGDRRVIMGGRKGFVTAFSETVATDCNSTSTSTANVAIPSYAYFGPVRPGGVEKKSKLIELLVNLGEPPSGFASSDFHCDVTISTGKGPYEAYNAPTGTVTASFNAVSGRQPGLHKRLCGGDFYVRFGNTNSGKIFIIDDVWGRFLPAGRDK